MMSQYRHWTWLAVFCLLLPAEIRAAEITEVCDAADEDDPFDANIDINFLSRLNRAKITHEWASQWSGTNRPDYDELRFQQQIYQMDYTIQIGLYHDVELYVNLPWIISDEKKINFVSGVNSNSSSVYRANPDVGFPGNAVAEDPTNKPTAKRSGIGDMQVGVKWAPFNDQRDDTKSVWVFGLDYRIPSGSLNNPQEVVGGKEGGVGLGQHVLTPFLLFSHRFPMLDPYMGLWGSIPIQSKDAKNLGLIVPYEGGVLAGLEIIPWENADKHQKFAIDVRLTADYVSEVSAEGNPQKKGTVNELSDFLVCVYCAQGGGQPADFRQLQSQGNYARFGLHLGFTVRAAELLRFRAGVSLEHNTEHFVTGADPCIDSNGDGACPNDPNDPENNDFYNRIYDPPGYRLRIEETTRFTYWFTGMVTF